MHTAFGWGKCNHMRVRRRTVAREGTPRGTPRGIPPPPSDSLRKFVMSEHEITDLFCIK